MKVVMISGSHPRHLYVIRKVAETGCLAGLVLMQREKMILDIPEGMDPSLTELYKHHFNLRAEMEEKYFGGEEQLAFIDSLDHLYVQPDELNGEKVENYLRKLNCDWMVSYGPNLIRPNILDIVHDHALNLHGGMSPYYKGAATMFWPFYFLEPNYVGTTLHYITQKIDGGRIVHHSVPKLEHGDCMHEVACKAIVTAAEDLKEILIRMDHGEVFEGEEQRKNGKLFLEREWRPEHLRLVYETYGDKIVDLYLDGKINRNNEPKLVRAF